MKCCYIVLCVHMWLHYQTILNFINCSLDNINAHADIQPVSVGMRFEIDEALFEEVHEVLEVESTQCLLKSYVCTQIY